MNFFKSRHIFVSLVIVTIISLLIVLSVTKDVRGDIYLVRSDVAMYDFD